MNETIIIYRKKAMSNKIYIFTKIKLWTTNQPNKQTNKKYITYIRNTYINELTKMNNKQNKLINIYI